MANAIELSVCGGDAAFRQIALTTCFFIVGFFLMLFAFVMLDMVSSVLAKRLAGKNVSEMTYFVWD